MLKSDCLKIVVNTRLLIKNRLEGIGWFTYENLKRIVINHPNIHFFFVFDREFDAEFVFADNITPIILSPQARHPILYYIWFEFSITQLLKDLKPDLFLSPDGYLSLRTNIKQYGVIHDINFYYSKNDLPKFEYYYYNYFFPKYAKIATRIGTVSEFSKNDISSTFRINPSKIDVVFNGVNENFRSISLLEIQSTKKKYTNCNDFFIYVGSLHPRKNIERLFIAFDEFRKVSNRVVKLVIVGKKMWWTNELESTYMSLRFKDDIVFTGRIEESELNKLIASSIALTYVSYFEGFGIPILEGFKCETAVITSNITSMPEVAANAAYLIDPYSIDSIKNGLIELSQNSLLRQSLINKGKIRVLDFSWNKTAELLWQSIEKAL